MATTKPRVTITLEPHVAETFRVFAEAQGTRSSKVISELLTEVEPSIRKTLAILLAAKDAPKEVLNDLRKSFDDVAKGVEALADNAYSQLDDVESQLGLSLSQPPYINKGVRSPNSQDGSSVSASSVVSIHSKGETKK